MPYTRLQRHSLPGQSVLRSRRRNFSTAKRWVRKYGEGEVIKKLALYPELLSVSAKKIVTGRDRKLIRKKIDSWFENTFTAGPSNKALWRRIGAYINC